jgi:hypothetical protein
MMDEDFPVILGFGSCHEMNEADPRNPRLSGLKSVSYAGACALRRADPQRAPLGFHRPARRTR